MSMRVTGMYLASYKEVCTLAIIDILAGGISTDT